MDVVVANCLRCLQCNNANELVQLAVNIRGALLQLCHTQAPRDEKCLLLELLIHHCDQLDGVLLDDTRTARDVMVPMYFNLRRGMPKVSE